MGLSKKVKKQLTSTAYVLFVSCCCLGAEVRSEVFDIATALESPGFLLPRPSESIIVEKYGPGIIKKENEEEITRRYASIESGKILICYIQSANFEKPLVEIRVVKLHSGERVAPPKYPMGSLMLAGIDIGDSESEVVKKLGPPLRIDKEGDKIAERLLIFRPNPNNTGRVLVFWIGLDQRVLAYGIRNR